MAELAILIGRLLLYWSRHSPRQTKLGQGLLESARAYHHLRELTRFGIQEKWMRHDLESNKKIAIAFYRMAKRRTASPCTDLQECKTPLGSSTVAVDAIAFRTSILAHIRANRYCGRERV